MGDIENSWDTQGHKYLPSRRDTVFLVLAGIFFTNAILGELIGGKLFHAGGYLISVGVLPWPVVFITTDLINEYFGPRAVRRLTLLAIVLILYAFLVLYAAMEITASPVSPVDDSSFRKVFGQSMWIIIGSVSAFAISQLVDALVFVFARAQTQGKLLWLRAVGSTVVSQLIDTFVINTIAFWLPGKLTSNQVLELSITNYGYKFLVAVATLPFIYLGHGVVTKYINSPHERKSG